MKQSIKLFRFSLFVMMVFLANPIFSQISAPRASFKSITNYTTASNDSVYVFCDRVGLGAGELIASSSDGSSGWTFSWTKWDSVTGTFATAVSSSNTPTDSNLSGLPDGLYKVEASNGTISYESQAWVLNNSNAKPGFVLNLMDCAGLHFETSFIPISLRYNDIYASDVTETLRVISESTDRIIRFSLERNTDPILTATENLGAIPYSIVEKGLVDQEAFDGELSFKVFVTDQYNCSFESDPISTSTYVVKADFSIDPMSGEAPLEVAFNNKSINADDFEWYIYQDVDRLEADLEAVEGSLLTDGILVDEDPIPYTYMHPGNYFVKLIVSSDKGPETCIDESFLKTKGTPIVVDTSLVQVPNVFTPNGDGRNDVFRVKSQSLKTFHAVLLNRWGRVVYEWKNPDEGWNGKVNGKWATPGTYFYVITATGREELKKKYTKKGSFMLIRK